MASVEDGALALPVARLDRLVAVLELDQPQSLELLAMSCAHRSWCAENPGTESNERLEFLGDAVLGFVVADRVYRENPGLDEGALTDVRKAVVNAVCLAEVAAEVDLGQHILLGKGEEMSGGREKPSILSDALEAVIGAVYLDNGMDAAASLIDNLLGDRIDAVVSAGGRAQDHKSLLQELVARNGGGVPRYSVDASGPDHARHFDARVAVGEAVLGTGQGRSKKQAEQQAARTAVESLESLESDGAASSSADEQGDDQGG